MNKKNKRSMVITFIVVEALLLFLGGAFLAGTAPNDKMVGNGLTGGKSLMWISFLVAFACYVAVDLMLFIKKEYAHDALKCNNKTNIKDGYEWQ